MYEVIPKLLWVGNAGDLLKPAAIELAGIKAVVQVALAEQMPNLSREMLVAHFPIMDGAENARGMIPAAVDMTVTLIRERVPTLLCCSGGMSRSPCVAAGALAIVNGRDPDVVLQEMIASKPHDVSPGLWAAVCTHVQRQRSRSGNS